MRASQKPIVVAISGQSCVGKTTAARALASRLGATLRLCGDEVKRRASELGVTPSELSNAEHESIDLQTRDLAENAISALVVEGNFLAFVLAGVDSILRVHLVASLEVREQRWRIRLKSAPEPHAGLRDRDVKDEELTSRLFKSGSTEGTAFHVIDTSTLSVDATVAAIQRLLDEER